MAKLYKILILSDTHTKHKEMVNKFDLPDADVIIHCGDITGSGSRKWTRNFLNWFDSLDQYEHKIFIAGNHDIYFEEDVGFENALNLLE